LSRKKWRTFRTKKGEKMPDILNKTERKMTTIDVGIDELEGQVLNML